MNQMRIMETCLTAPECEEVAGYELDEEVFSRIYSENYTKLKSLALRYTGCEFTAEEVVSDIFYKIWNKRAELGVISRIESYLCVAVRNQSFNYIQKCRKVRFCDIDEARGLSSNEGIDPETSYLHQELEVKVEDAISKLPKKCGRIYRMVRMEGMRHKQVSDELGISVKTIEVQIGIALKRMHHQLTPYCYQKAV